jgi:hypothetical protein
MVNGCPDGHLVVEDIFSLPESDRFRKESGCELRQYRLDFPRGSMWFLYDLTLVDSYAPGITYRSNDTLFYGGGQPYGYGYDANIIVSA